MPPSAQSRKSQLLWTCSPALPFHLLSRFMPRCNRGQGGGGAASHHTIHKISLAGPPTHGMHAGEGHSATATYSPFFMRPQTASSGDHTDHGIQQRHSGHHTDQPPASRTPHTPHSLTHAAAVAATTPTNHRPAEHHTLHTH